MKTFFGLDAMRAIKNPVVLAAGFFDGVHLGHQRLIKSAVAEGKKTGTSWVMTFDTHPMKVLAPEKAPLLLTAITHKLNLLKSLGTDGCVTLHFTRELARMEPEAFIEMLKQNIPALHVLFIGQNWTFGHGGRGDAKLLKNLARLNGFKVRIIPPVCLNGLTISSTRIRSAIVSGALDEASAMLGRTTSVMGTVIRGNRLGTEIGIPTANLDPHNEIYPPDGVYAARAMVDGKLHDGILNLGTRPTIKTEARTGAKHGSTRVLELHLFDTRMNLYKKEIEVFFVRKLRNERRFSSIEALKRQIGFDIEQARGILAGWSQL